MNELLALRCFNYRLGETVSIVGTEGALAGKALYIEEGRECLKAVGNASGELVRLGLSQQTCQAVGVTMFYLAGIALTLGEESPFEILWPEDDETAF